jgi:GNAT superfamily N-acetyltransferase
VVGHLRSPPRPVPLTGPAVSGHRAALGPREQASSATPTARNEDLRWQQRQRYGEAVQIRARQAADRLAVQAFLTRRHHSRVARLGALVDPLDFPALIAEAEAAEEAGEDGRLVGVLTYVPDRDQQQWEILTLHTARQWHGVGTALIEAVQRLAAPQGCTRLWLITTNDNLDALRFYQRRGFCLAALYRGAVDDSRARLKPEIPTVGDHGIPLRDELGLEKRL